MNVDIVNLTEKNKSIQISHPHSFILENLSFVDFWFLLDLYKRASLQPFEDFYCWTFVCLGSIMPTVISNCFCAALDMDIKQTVETNQIKVNDHIQHGEKLSSSHCGTGAQEPICETHC